MEIKKYSSGDEKEILELFHLVFKQEMTLDSWYWRFKNNPFTDDVFIYLMWEGKKLIGHYAVSPMEMKYNGSIIKTALSMTTMTHPEYGGKGVFSKLAEKLYSDLKNDYGYKMVWGFPNNNSHYGFIKNLNWKDISVIPMMTLKLSEMRMTRSDDVLYGIENSLTKDQIQKLNVSTKELSLNKNKEYLNWRYLLNPICDYKILNLMKSDAFVVYKVIKSFTNPEEQEVDIMELYFNDISELTQLINAVIKHEVNINQFNIWKSLFTENRILFEKIGFKMNLPLTYLSHLNLDPNNDFSEFRNWELGLDYSDVF